MKPSVWYLAVVVAAGLIMHSAKAQWYDSLSNRRCPVCVQKGCSLLSCPAVVARWDYVRNGKLRPEDLGVGSGKKVWLKKKKWNKCTFYC